MQTIIFIIFWNFLMFYQIFLPPQVKRRVIIGNKHDICDLRHELPNNFRLNILGNKEKSGKSQNLVELQYSTQSPCKNENCFNTFQKLLKNRYLTSPVGHYLTWKLQFFSNILWMTDIKFAANVHFHVYCQ